MSSVKINNARQYTHSVIQPAAGVPVPVTASMMVPQTESVHLRFKADPPGWEAAAWLCAQCGRELFRHELDASAAPAQEGYWRACERFNAEAALRECRGCGARHPPADLTDIKWNEVAAQLRAQDQADQRDQRDPIDPTDRPAANR